ncbi:hypothetical protein Ct61P_15611 [Colletotrichum tofieldiae]|nr:hypothetical protein Ct61P_15601 [Colletotrichum tofieldiae]GKT97752.1 hypothetical protein Ct61P_15602 [Colletotrichum tofieldiae]GKT97753.1 hypothetical protein Ct61P_15603 [Colletotrichum tofieldiae]GKT97755.1 hypothetical protein Ct61P_15605 [Colletotrichum tofieldiae]GKT97756.1 hypothetical protein Ct61P_15606 [Colletotrichum tofieldiae]
MGQAQVPWKRREPSTLEEETKYPGKEKTKYPRGESTMEQAQVPWKRRAKYPGRADLSTLEEQS